LLSTTTTVLPHRRTRGRVAKDGNWRVLVRGAPRAAPPPPPAARSGPPPWPPTGGRPPMGANEVKLLIADVDGWEAPRDHHLTKTFKFPDFARALAFVDRVGAMAEEQSHHPDLHLSWGR